MLTVTVCTSWSLRLIREQKERMSGVCTNYDMECQGLFTLALSILEVPGGTCWGTSIRILSTCWGACLCQASCGTTTPEQSKTTVRSSSNSRINTRWLSTKRARQLSSTGVQPTLPAGHGWSYLLLKVGIILVIQLTLAFCLALCGFGRAKVRAGL